MGEPARRHRRARLADEAVIAVRDEGPGFDRSLVPDPTDPMNLETISGRGLFLIQNFVDESASTAGGMRSRWSSVVTTPRGALIACGARFAAGPGCPAMWHTTIVC